MVIHNQLEQVARIKVSEKEGEDEFEDVLLIVNPPMKDWATPGTDIRFMLCAPSIMHEFDTILCDIEEEGFSLEGKPVVFEDSEKVHELVSAKIREIGGFS